MHCKRSCGTLLHPTSLPGPHGSGDLGPAAYRFVDWLANSGQGCWQVLPLGAIGKGNSPYMSPSAFAGNPLLIDLAELLEAGWLRADDIAEASALPADHIDFERTIELRMRALEQAARRFQTAGNAEQHDSLQAFREAESGWLEDYALFMTLFEAHDGRDWCDWGRPLALRDATALERAGRQYAERIAFWRFCQWLFFRQWQRLREYANARGIEIIGDTPIFPAYNSAEVWARRDLFALDEGGRQTVVAGVPPDYFSETGQRWGNPLYRWSTHRNEGFAWWIERIRHSLRLVDRLRVDHFIGFVRCWEIDADEPTAIRGRWTESPGAELFAAVEAALGRVPIIAEDLGLVTDAVHALREHCGFPGMAVLQFAWGADGNAEFLPHRHRRNLVVYSGTHDNDTARGWWDQVDETVRDHLRRYLATDAGAIHLDLARCALASVADTAIIPLQDWLGLGSENRMNRPGHEHGNWHWRFAWEDLHEDASRQIAELVRLYERDSGRAATDRD